MTYKNENNHTHLPPNTALSLGDRANASTGRIQLHTRGITGQAVDYAQIRTTGRGWLYPVAPHTTAQRFKAFPNQPGAKYRWHPRQPKTVRFYDPQGQLAGHVAAAGGVLYLASGEPDTWVLFSAERFNATCTLHGEGTIPPWFVDELHRLKVATVLLWPDRDHAGNRHAAKIAAALQDSGIAVEIYALPYAPDSKADLNTLWLDCDQDRDRFATTLMSCEPFAQPEPVQPQPVRHALPIPDADLSSLYEQWCLEVERVAVQAWSITPPNGKNLSRRNFSSPWRDDLNPSAQWNYTVHGFKDYGAGGEFFNTSQVAELLGFQPWPDYYRDHAPQPSTPGCSVTPPHATHHFRQGIPTRLIEFLLNLHGDPWLNVQRRDLQDAGAATAVWCDWHDQIITGKIEPTAPVTAQSMVTHSLHGLSWDTAKAGLNRLEELGIFGVYAPYLESAPDKEQKLRKCGRRGNQYTALPLAQSLPALLDYIAPYMLRVVLVNEYPEVPVSAERLAGIVTGMAPGDVAAIDEQCAGLYAHHAEERAAALHEYARRLAFFRTKYITGVLDPSGKYPLAPFQLPEGAQVPNAAAFRNVVDDLDMRQHEGERDARARREAARRTGRTLAAHTRAAKKRDIMPVPQADRYPLDPETDVLSQCTAIDVYALARGAISLVADSGARVYVNEHSARDYDDWAEQHGGAAIEIRRASVEKRIDLITAEERTAMADLSAQQAERTGYRRTGAINTPAEHPVHAWAIRQGELRASAFGLQAIPETNPRCYLDTTTGELWDRSTIWQGILTAMRNEGINPPVSPEPVQPNEPVMAGNGHEHEGMAAPEPGGQAPPGHVCAVCGQPAARTLLDGYYCPDHARLAWYERQKAASSTRRLI